MFLTARRLFDGRTPEVFSNWVVEIDDGRILDVGPLRASLPESDVVDLGDVTLLPGLMDIHQHLAFDASDQPVTHLEADDDAMLLCCGCARRRKERSQRGSPRSGTLATE